MAERDRLDPVLASTTPSDLWAALVSDTDRPIVVISPEGEVLFANAEAAEHVGRDDPGEVIGGRMQDLCEETYAAERLACIGEVAESGRVLALEGMTRGRMRRTIMRPIGERPDGRHYVLLTHIPVPVGETGRAGRDIEVRRAQIDDYGPLASLSDRELEVLTLIARGKTTAEIGKAMHRSVKTVEWHRVALGTKLGVSNRVELARIAIRAGLVDLEDALQIPPAHEEPEDEPTHSRATKAAPPAPSRSGSVAERN